MLRNGFGEHNIQGIGDKHIPLIHNVLNTDVAARGLRPRDRPARRPVRHRGRAGAYLAAGAAFRRRCSPASTRSGSRASATCSPRSRPAKHYGLGPEDVVVDGRDRRRGDVRQRARAARSPGTSPTDSTRSRPPRSSASTCSGPRPTTCSSSTRVDRERIFNLGYYTWVEQQGISLDDFEARRDPAFWTRHPRGRRRLGRADRRVQRPHRRPGGAVSVTASRLVCAGCGAEPDAGRPVSVPLPERRRGRRRRPRPAARARPLDAVRFPADDAEPNPFLRYRALLHAYHVAPRGGLSDDALLRPRARPRRGASPRSTGTASSSRPSPAATS